MKKNSTNLKKRILIPLLLILTVSLINCGRKDNNDGPTLLLPALAWLLYAGNQEAVFNTFVTTAVYNGDLKTAAGNPALNGPTAGDALCQSDANNPGGGTYKALLADGVNRRACSSSDCATSGAVEHIDWVLRPNTTYYRREGLFKILTTNDNGVVADLYYYGSGTAYLDNSPDGDTPRVFWTGIEPNWVTSNTCSGWTTALSGSFGLGGATDWKDGNALGHQGTGCNGTLYLLCVRQ